MTIDYTASLWGRAVNVIRVQDDGQRLNVVGYGPIPRHGDYILLPNGDQSTRYRVDSDVRVPPDPGDQWFADLEFTPRQSPS